MDAVTSVPVPYNEPVREYPPGSAQCERLQRRITELRGDRQELTLTVGGVRRMAGGTRFNVVEPHRRSHVLGEAAQATEADVASAVRAVKQAAPCWRGLPFDERAAVFLRAADLLAGPWRDTLNAATMLGQSKSVQQAEIDSACELIDFWRFNVYFARQHPCRTTQFGAGRVEPHRSQAIGRFRDGDHTVQLHCDRRQSSDRPGLDG